MLQTKCLSDPLTGSKTLIPASESGLGTIFVTSWNQQSYKPCPWKISWDFFINFKFFCHKTKLFLYFVYNQLQPHKCFSKVFIIILPSLNTGINILALRHVWTTLCAALFVGGRLNALQCRCGIMHHDIPLDKIPFAERWCPLQLWDKSAHCPKAGISHF